MQFFNDLILHLALHGRGYNNCCSTSVSGEEIFFKILSRHKPKICIDIGANIGEYSRRILSITQSEVIAFEPLPKAFQSLTNLSEQFDGRLTAINEGLADRIEILELYYGMDDSELATFSKEAHQINYISSLNTNSLKVKVNTLDNFISKNNLKYNEIDLLKIDTEGYEFEVLNGARLTVEKFKPKFIQIEFNWHQLFKNHTLYQISGLLQNYVAYQILPYGKGLIIRDLNKPESNIFRYSNFLFVRNDINLI